MVSIPQGQHVGLSSGREQQKDRFSGNSSLLRNGSYCSSEDQLPASDHLRKDSGRRELLFRSVRDINLGRLARRTALPSSDEPCAQQLTSFRWSKSRHKHWMIPEEIVEFKNGLGQIAKDEETAIDCPTPV